MARKKQRKGLLGTLGIKAEPLPSSEDKTRDERHKKIAQAWTYLRDRIDRGIAAYFSEGSAQKLAEHVERPALDALVAELDRLRDAGVVGWAQPDRATVTQPQYKVISEELNEAMQPTKFVIEERFKDFSELRSRAGATERCPGTERVIQASVSVLRGTEFKLVSVIEVREATL
jgi:hypothetical protein